MILIELPTMRQMNNISISLMPFLCENIHGQVRGAQGGLEMVRNTKVILKIFSKSLLEKRTSFKFISKCFERLCDCHYFLDDFD